MAATPSPSDAPIRQQLQGLNLYLIGLMGSGKSATGQAIAQRLQYRFFDTDTLIERIVGKAIATIFAEDGEATFRQIEQQTLGQLAAYQRSVVATGGGIILERNNWSALRQGVIIWLDVPIPQIYQRLMADPAEIAQRPLLQTPDPQAALETLHRQRRHLYEQADLRLIPDPTDTADTVADRVLAALPTALRDPSDRPVPPDPTQN
ncbi:MAG: shikimate kinase [Cyanophyceae cyanobacterium]